jgi:hypothetical protein
VNEQQQAELPFMVVAKLNEGYVLSVQGYGIAITNAEDLARRVGEIAASTEVGFQSPQPQPEHDISDTIQVQQGPPPPPQMDVQATAQTLQAASQDAVVPTANLEAEWANVRQMIAFMAAGADTNGKAFTRKEWDAALPIFAPHVDPKEAEFELSEFLSEMHDDD